MSIIIRNIHIERVNISICPCQGELVLTTLNGKVQGALTFFPPQLSKFPRFGRSEREN